MYTNVNLAAPVGALAFLGSAALVLCAGLILVYSVLRKRSLGIKLSLFGIGAIGVLYAIAMLAFSVTSHEEVLARGEEKHFCEIDCHLAYSVVEVKQTRQLGEPGQQQVPAAGQFYVITLKTRFDENTTSSTRGNALLYPNSRVLSVKDERGRTFLPDSRAQQFLQNNGAAGTSLASPLRPGESYITNIVFDLPTDISRPVLLVREGEWVTSFVIGHENSVFHKKTRFGLE